MPYFGSRSSKNLSEAHEDLQRLFKEVIKYYDCSVICAHRGAQAQNIAYFDGRSTKMFPDSQHNKLPSLAVDVVPYFKYKPHVRWEDSDKFYEFAGFVQGVACMLDIDIRWGGNWDGDDELHDQSLMDLPHFELI